MDYGDFEYTVTCKTLKAYTHEHGGRFFIAEFSNGFQYTGIELRSHAQVFDRFEPGKRYRLTFRDEEEADRAKGDG